MQSFFIPTNVRKFPEPIRGTVEKTITPEQNGRVKCLGSYWPAQLYLSSCQATLLEGESVNVIGMQGITMLVAPIHT
jgi:membrane protein implicated in regulation of membrane protease activity